MTIKRTLGKFGSRFAFEFFLETMHDQIIQGFKKYLSDIRVEDIPAMVRKSQFPHFKHLDFSAVEDNKEHIRKISLVRLVEFIFEARPDLAKAIQDTGKAGAEYMVKLRVHLIDKIGQPAGGKEFKPQEDMAMAHCDECNNKWPVKKDEATSIRKCPFCGAGEDEPKKPPSEDE